MGRAAGVTKGRETLSLFFMDFEAGIGPHRVYDE
jgi:hypothetical protein